MNKILRVPFTFHGFVDIEATEEEYESDIAILDERAAESFDNDLLVNEMDFGGFDFTSAEWLEEEE